MDTSNMVNWANWSNEKANERESLADQSMNEGFRLTMKAAAKQCRVDAVTYLVSSVYPCWASSLKEMRDWLRAERRADIEFRKLCEEMADCDA